MAIKTFIYRRKGNAYYVEPGSIWTRDLFVSGRSMDEHIEEMQKNGWEVMNSSSDSGHVKTGLALVTGGLSLLVGGRTPSTITLTFTKR